MPNVGNDVTQEEINDALNIDHFKGSKPDPGTPWHQGPDTGGLFENWSTRFGYNNGPLTGFPLYGGVLLKNEKIHIYYLPTKDKTILLRATQTPQDYGVNP
jgi:hypothetical protein